MARRAGVAVAVYARQGDAANAILDVAEERNADLVIIGNKGLTPGPSDSCSSFRSRIRSPTFAPCSVMIIRTT